MRSDRGYPIDGYDFAAGPLERSPTPIRGTWPLWAPVVVMLLVFLAAVVRW